jgi:sugar lactone lactonase YvrE
VEIAIPGARLPNGMTWSADGRTMFWIDSFLNCVDAFDFDGHAGALRNRRTVVKCPRQGAAVHGAVGGACVRDGRAVRLAAAFC